jgi:hypothetical protein
MEGIMGLREKLSVYRILFDILFFYEGPLLILKSRDLRKINRGGSLCHLTAHQMRYVATNRWWER